MTKREKSSEDALEWAKDALRRAVNSVTDRGAIESPLVESRPVWAHGREVVIGQLRDAGARSDFLWVIGGSVPADCVPSKVAASPRDAARHFAMKWQLEAARLAEPSERQRLGLDPSVDWGARSEALVRKAEYLYDVSADDTLWA
jgi:hypothetical protein